MMQLHRVISDAHQGAEVLNHPPRLEKSWWETYRVLLPLLTDRHVAAVLLLEEQYQKSPKSFYETPVAQSLLNRVLLQGIHWLRVVDDEISALLYAGGDVDYVTSYLDALHQLRKVVELTIKHYYRLRGTPDDPGITLAPG